MSAFNKKIMDKSKSSVNYIGMFDLSKGILMILIILLHAITDYFKYWEFDFTQFGILAVSLYPVKLFIYGVAPMFFMICGYGFRKKE